MVAPGAALRGPDPSGGMGQFWLVVRGALDGLPPLSLVFVAPDEPALEASAGPDGAEVLVMQYPRRGAMARAA